jgi:hypothetical protein
MVIPQTELSEADFTTGQEPMIIRQKRGVRPGFCAFCEVWGEMLFISELPAGFDLVPPLPKVYEALFFTTQNMQQ